MATVAAISRTAWRPSATPRAHKRSAPRSVAPRAAASAGAALAEQERQLLAAVSSLGYPAAIFPGDEAQRAGIDATIEQLEAASPTPEPLRSPLLLGDWKLVYASSGTYVTRTAAAQALLAASRVPGVGVADIRQGLQLPAAGGSLASSSGSSASSGGGGGSGSGDVAAQQLRTSNAANFGLGPFGDWEVEIQGTWDVQNASLARVKFDGFKLQLVGLLGLIKLPSMAKVKVPVNNSAAADFHTTYLSQDVRVARGRSRNIFLFTRLP